MKYNKREANVNAGSRLYVKDKYNSDSQKFKFILASTIFSKCWK